ncbi:MAG TPA: AgmX/PglI C-terminal domain-containing protein, partial [Polyangiaceae bacterium]|nr:AgmX/PglI C-terminal domain-containing protein [Polyangiaceae bacterium]
MARQQALRDATEFGMIGLLNSGSGGDPNAPTAPWGRDDSLGNDVVPFKGGSDAQAARGNMWGGDIGDASGAAGLGLSGVAEGGGGRGEGLGLGSIGTIGHGAGTGTGQGFGAGHGRLGGAHKSSPPQVRMGETTVNGKLPPPVIQRIVRQNFGRFRICYENGLKNNPNLQGRVAVRFVIRADGEVTNVLNAGSDMPDSSVVSCVVKSFQGLSFPQPEQGIVSVTYPIMFSPGGGSIEKEDATKAKPIAAEERAKQGAPEKTVIEVRVGDVSHTARLCGEAASLPLEERAILWRERLANFANNPESAANVYRKALANCEAPSWRERSRLLSLMLDAIPGMSDRVALWRAMLREGGAADALYRGMLARVRTADQARELNRALGLKSIDPGILAKAMKEAKSPQDRVARLRAFTAEWPDDRTLSRRLLDDLEDAGDVAGARSLGRSLRARPDADARIRTAVGELSLRLAARAASPEEKALDEAEARRAFGEIVEFAPDDPVARRRLGDLLRAHGWFADAARQYETLALLAPDDPSVALLRAAAAEGLGKLEEAVRWTEKGGSAGAPDVEQSPAFTARAFSATYLAWGILAAE